MTTVESLRALNRFGLGARPGEADRINPKSWLREQVRAEAALLKSADLKSTTELVSAISKAKRAPKTDTNREAYRKFTAQQYQTEANAAITHGLNTDTPFAERMVRFWSNHFTVSAQGEPEVRLLAGAYEREAIRPNVFGKFEDLVLATARHPAMLIYLDQMRSFGPNSKIGRRRKAGLNENYARELMELHTLGVNGGYDQTDVEALASVLTGWTVGGITQRSAPAPFRFEPAIHEPGNKQLLSRTIRQSGEAEGIEAIRILARHPSTAQFIATKLITHFVADTPPKRGIDKIARVFHDSGGNLAKVTLALVDLEAPFDTENRKFRTPQEYIFAIGRALNIREAPKNFLAVLNPLRHPYWGALSPAGYGDTAQDWADPDALIKRTDLALKISQKLRKRRLDANALAPQLIEAHDLGVLRQALSTQRDPSDALALLLASPDFQWR